MYRQRIFTLGLMVLLGLCAARVEALGVASQVSQVSNGRLVTVTGWHAPQADIVVVDGNGQVVASALDSGTGLFDFSFRVDPDQEKNLQIFAVDPANQTRPISLDPDNSQEILLPPSMAINPAVPLKDDRIGLGGFSYIGATVEIEIIGDNGYQDTAIEVADVEGGWLTEFANLEPGRYQISARSRITGATSRTSLPLEIVVEPKSVIEEAIPEPVDRAGQTVERVVDQVVPEPIRQSVEPVAPQARQIAETTTPIASAGLLTQVLFASRDIFYVAFQAVISGLQYFGFWRKKNPWGVVYDAVTKQPIMLATVRLYAVGTQRRLVETDVTSKAGVFSFEVAPGAYEIKVAKSGYSFPSQLVQSSVDGEYSHVYHGERVQIQEHNRLVDVSVPLDPAEANSLTLTQKVKIFIRQRLYLFTQGMLVIGFVMSAIALVGGQRGVNGVLFVFYSAILLGQWYVYLRKKQAWGVVVDTQGKPVGGIQISLIDPRFNKLVQRRVSDEQGRYQFVVPAGSYKIRIDTLNVQLHTNKKKAYRGEEIEVQGEKPHVITQKLVVEDTPQRDDHRQY